MSLESFIAEYEELTQVNPLHHRERVWDYEGRSAVCFELSVFGGAIRLANIRSIESRKGFGTLALIWLTTLADKHDVSITGTASPTGAKLMNKTALKKWYERHGFLVSRRGELHYLPNR
jgi:hypothetical protein